MSIVLYKMCWVTWMCFFVFFWPNLDVVVGDLELANSTLVNGFLVALTTKKVLFSNYFQDIFSKLLICI